VRDAITYGLNFLIVRAFVFNKKISVSPHRTQKGYHASPLTRAPLTSKKMLKIVDLTHTLTPEIHTYPGDPEFSAEPAFQFPDGDGVRIHALHLGTHTGTHIDAPYHFYKNWKNIDEIPLEWLVGRPVVVPLSMPETGSGSNGNT
jgi:hypothetical protein